MRILIVDDNEQNLYMLRALLEGNGHEVVPAGNGKEALEKALADPPDIIISDILMPVMDGFALCREWKRDELLRRIPFVFYTATYTDPKDEEFAMRLGADKFIAKPVDPDLFMAQLEEVMKKVETEALAPAAPSLKSEEETLRLYNQRLINKLEKKMKDLEIAAREAEEARKVAQEAHEYAKAIVETVRIPLVVLDADLRLLSANSVFYDTFRLSREEVSGKLLFEIDGNRWDVPALRVSLEQVLKSDTELEGLEIEQDVPFLGGRVICMSARPICSGGERTGRILVTMEDVTEWKRMLEELRESGEKYRELVENANSIIMRMDIHGNITFFNEFAQSFFGFSDQEAIGRNVIGTIVPDLEANRRDLASMIEDIASEPDKYMTREYMNVRKDGRKVWVAWTNKAVFDDAGKVAEILAIGVDVTDQRRIQRKLEMIKGLFLSLGTDVIENIEMVLRTGRDILEASCMQYCRLQKGRLISMSVPSGETGYELVEKPEEHLCCKVIGSSEQRPLLIDDFSMQPRGSLPREVEGRGMAFFAGYPVKVGSEVIGCLSVWDERPRRLSQDEVDTLGTLARIVSTEEERLAREERMKDLVDIASHELRHPMTLMKGYATSLRDLWNRLEDEERLQMLFAIDYGVDRMEKVVRELLDVSRIERGRFRINRRKTAVGNLITRAISEMRDKGVTNDIFISLKNGDMPLWVDPDRILQLLVILLDNAVEFSPEGSRIEIEVRAEAEGLMVSVLDEGQGIPKGQEESVFERFYQVEESIHHSKPGIGLGLYIAKEIVEAHGGRIWNEPREGGGTAFRFFIPLRAHALAR